MLKLPDAAISSATRALKKCIDQKMLIKRKRSVYGENEVERIKVC